MWVATVTRQPTLGPTGPLAVGAVNLPPQGESNSGDSSEFIFSVYTGVTEDKNETKMARP